MAGVKEDVVFRANQGHIFLLKVNVVPGKLICSGKNEINVFEMKEEEL